MNLLRYLTRQGKWKDNDTDGNDSFHKKNAIDGINIQHILFKEPRTKIYYVCTEGNFFRIDNKARKVNIHKNVFLKKLEQNKQIITDRKIISILLFDRIFVKKKVRLKRDKKRTEDNPAGLDLDDIDRGILNRNQTFSVALINQIYGKKLSNFYKLIKPTKITKVFSNKNTFYILQNSTSFGFYSSKQLDKLALYENTELKNLILNNEATFCHKKPLLINWNELIILFAFDKSFDTTINDHSSKKVKIL